MAAPALGLASVEVVKASLEKTNGLQQLLLRPSSFSLLLIAGELPSSSSFVWLM
uniref:Uncharacterized protein n=1 Tax=Oryza sativa subsp. japonica TaxID=39947 RepID=Q6YU80_ORYSJ|nr:hypothetical protein [Oryza sativa Japonica Group]BAD08198.1 hypothetical protein [Oryza sativa Japonica Group]